MNQPSLPGTLNEQQFDLYRAKSRIENTGGGTDSVYHRYAVFPKGADPSTATPHAAAEVYYEGSFGPARAEFDRWAPRDEASQGQFVGGGFSSAPGHIKWLGASNQGRRSRALPMMLGTLANDHPHVAGDSTMTAEGARIATKYGQHQHPDNPSGAGWHPSFNESMANSISRQVARGAAEGSLVSNDEKFNGMLRARRGRPAKEGPKPEQMRLF